jgi:hypothetical protein
MDAATISALSVVMDQRAGDIISMQSRIEQLQNLNMNEHTEVFIAATRRLCKIESSRIFRDDTGKVTAHAVNSTVLDVHMMMYGADDSDDVPAFEPVLPLWFEIDKLEIDIVIDVLTRRGFELMHFKDDGENPFTVSWIRPYRAESATKINWLVENGMRLCEPTNHRIPVQF